MPDPPYSGGAQRTRLLLDVLRKLGTVDCALILPCEPDGSALSWLSERCGQVHIVTKRQLQDARPAAFIRRWLPKRPGEDIEFLLDAERYRWLANPFSVRALGALTRYDVVVSRYLQSALTFAVHRHPKWLLDVDDYLPDRIRARLPLVNPFRRLALRRCLRYAEAAHTHWIHRAAGCWVSNPGDRRHPGLSRATLLPNIPWSDSTAPCPVTRDAPPLPTPYLLFVGSLSYSANSDAVDWFLQSIWPLVRQDCPTVQLAVVGSGLPARLRRKWQPTRGLVLAGRIMDLAPWYRHATAVIAPIRSGAGTNIKVLEAAHHGKCLIGTSAALRGFQPALQHDRDCWIADEPLPFSRYCMRALQNPGSAEVMARSAQKAVQAQFSTTVFETAVYDALRSLLNPQI